MNENEEKIAAALKPFGWTCTPEFWGRYYEDAWVFNLANAVVALDAVPSPREEALEAALHELVEVCAQSIPLGFAYGSEELQAAQALLGER